MLEYIIEGGRKLEGNIDISGSKNASLPRKGGAILNGGITKLYNIPNIDDTKISLEILEYLGCKVKKSKGKLEINSKTMNKVDIPEDKMIKMRSTVTMAGAILGRFKKVIFTYPGGCEIGARPIDLHLKAFKKLGINIEENYRFIRCTCDKIIGTDIDLDFPSVGATENIILATVLSQGITTITNAALEPEITDLCVYLNKMGAKIEGIGTSTIKIRGVKVLKDVSYKIIPDRIEAGTYLCIAAATGGRVCLNNVEPTHIIPVISKLEEAGCKLDVQNTKIQIEAPKRLKAVDIKTFPYPGFPTDMQQVFGAMLAKAKGTSIIIENIFENRFKYMSELKKMGAKVAIEGKTGIIKGTNRLNAAILKSTDLRGGAALVLAALTAKGKSRVEDIEYILRGYEKFDEKLQNIGAKIYIEKS